MANPYEYDESMDADIFESDAASASSASRRRHPVDGSMCPTCNVVHRVPADLPDEVVDKVLGFVDQMPDELANMLLSSSSVDAPKYAKMTTMILRFTTQLDESNEIGPLLRSIVEHLDEKTDGKISRRWRIYEIERRILSTHYTLKAINNSLQEAHARGADYEFVALLTIMMDFMGARIDFLKGVYEEETAGDDTYTPIEEIIRSGTYPSDMNDQVKHFMLEDVFRELDE